MNIHRRCTGLLLKNMPREYYSTALLRTPMSKVDGNHLFVLYEAGDHTLYNRREVVRLGLLVQVGQGDTLWFFNAVHHLQQGAGRFEHLEYTYYSTSGRTSRLMGKFILMRDYGLVPRNAGRVQQEAIGIE